ncbi:MAG: ASKHA domain-containing protein [Archaeoglobaceae archaeon]
MSDAEIFIPPESRLERQQILRDFFIKEKEFSPLIKTENYENAFLPELLSKKGYKLLLIPEIEEGDFKLVGTTTIVAALVDMNTGKILNIASDYNGQIIYGEEVLSRVEFARTRKDGIEILQKAVIDSINKLIDNLLQGYSSSNRIYDIVVAGNTLMTHFFLGKDVEYLFESEIIKRESYKAKANNLGLKANKNAEVCSLPSVSKFIGGDVVGGVLAAKIVDSGRISLFVDLGTNGEIILGSEGWIMSASVASGPAFEGYEIKHGSRAVTGAIDHVWSENGEIKYSVIGNTKPRSICGSGLIDLLAELFKKGIVDFQGNLKENPRVVSTTEKEFVIVEAEKSATEKPITLTQTDIDTLIKSKAAVCAGIAVLLKKAGVSIEDIEDFYIAGAFGYYLNVENAITIGLFPEIKAKIRQIGNGSLVGAYLALNSNRKRELAETIAKIFSYFDLSTDADFIDEYRAALVLPGRQELFPSIYARFA